MGYFYSCSFILLCIYNSLVYAHQFTPTYPKLEFSFVEDVLQAKMELFNSRKDVSYYELNVYTLDWKPVTFASEEKLVPMRYLETKKLNVYIRKQDINKAVYICTTSKLQKENVKHTGISSRICSKIKP